MTLNRILKFSWRYFRAKKSAQAINIISWVSVVAIAFGTAALITILSAFNGFESLVKSLYASFYPAIKISPAQGKVITITPQQWQLINSLQGIEAISKTVEGKALLQQGPLQAVVQLKGVDDQYTAVSGVTAAMYRGVFSTGTEDKPGLVLGVGIEQALGIVSDRAVFPVSVYLPRKKVQQFTDPSQALSMSLAYPQGSFAIQSEFDNNYVLTNLEFVKTYMGFGETEYAALELKMKPGVDEAMLLQQLKDLLGAAYRVEDRYQQNSTLYATIRLEKLAIYGIFSLMLLVAAFNMIGSLSMLVLEKRQDIQVLKSMGAEDGLIRKIFFAEGILLAAIGTAAGLLMAMLVYFLQTRFKLVPLEGSTFLIDYYPMEIVAADILVVLATVFTIGVLASWMPSVRASKQTISLRSS
jgi:lipoprotein-releasing system permease protein